MPDTLKERAKAFREMNDFHKTYPLVSRKVVWGELLAELSWARKNHPFGSLRVGYREKWEGYETALAFVESLLKEPEGK